MKVQKHSRSVHRRPYHSENFSWFASGNCKPVKGAKKNP